MNVVDHPTYRCLTRKDTSGVVFYGAARFPIADSVLSEFYHSAATVGTPTGVSNFSHCAVADRGIEAARVASDPEAQNAMYVVGQTEWTYCAIEPNRGLMRCDHHRRLRRARTRRRRGAPRKEANDG